jgi:Tol biopolymer transport system component
VRWNEDIWVMDTDGTHARKVVTTEGNDHWMPTWSPDGGHLMFTADGTEKDGEIVRVDLTSGEVIPVTDNEVHDMMPSWRPAD